MRSPRAEPRHASVARGRRRRGDRGAARDGRQGRRPGDSAADERCQLARPRRLPPARRARRARDRRAEDAVARGARRRRRRDRRHEPRAGLDEQRARQREAPDHAALAPGRRRASRLQLRARARRLLGARRRERSADHRARRQRRRRLPGPRRVSRDDLDPRALARRLRAALRSPAGDRDVGSRRTRRHDRAARHRRRRRVPYLRGRVGQGIDVVGGSPDALAAAKPDDPTQVERHGTQMAGLLVGAGGPSGLAGVATGASVLPIRVAGWQPDALGHYAIYARTDQIIAGLERAVDPNDDGDAHDAARIALVALAEPFAAFTDSPGGARGAGRARPRHARRRARRQRRARGGGLRRRLGAGRRPCCAHRRRARCANANRPHAHLRARRARHAARRRSSRWQGPCGRRAGSTSRVAVPARHDQRHAAHGSAAHRLLQPLGPQHRRGAGCARSGRRARRLRQRLVPPRRERLRCCSTAGALPAGGLGLDEAFPIPVLSIPTAAAHAALRRIARGSTCRSRCTRSRACRTPSRTASRASPRRASRSTAASSRTSSRRASRSRRQIPGADADGSPRFVTVNGSSAAAATVAGAAALLAQARPALGASALGGLLVGSAQQLPVDPVTHQGAGLVDVGAATRRRGRGVTVDSRARPLHRRGLARERVVHRHEPVDANAPPRARRAHAAPGRGRRRLPAPPVAHHPPAGKNASSYG